MPALHIWSEWLVKMIQWENVGSADHPVSPTISVSKWKPWPQMRHCTQSSCGMGITMEDLTWHPWHLGGHRATGHPTDLAKQSDAKGSLNLHEFAWIPAAKHGLKWGMEYGLEWDEAFDIHTMHFVAKLVPLYDCLGSGVLARVQAVPNEEIYNFILQEPFGQQGKMTGESCLHRSSCTRAQRKRAGRHAHVNTLRHVTVWCIYIYISPSNLRQLQFTVQISVQKNWICEDPFFQQTRFFSIKNDAWNLQSTNLQTTNLAH